VDHRVVDRLVSDFSRSSPNASMPAMTGERLISLLPLFLPRILTASISQDGSVHTGVCSDLELVSAASKLRGRRALYKEPASSPSDPRRTSHFPAPPAVRHSAIAEASVSRVASDDVARLGARLGSKCAFQSGTGHDNRSGKTACKAHAAPV